MARTHLELAKVVAKVHRVPNGTDGSPRGARRTPPPGNRLWSSTGGSAPGRPDG